MKTFTPALDMLYAGLPGGVVMPCFDPVLITIPGRPRAIIPGTKVWVPKITPQRLVPMIFFQASSGPKTPVPGPMPALFISTSAPPKRSPTAASSACRSASRLTSVSIAITASAPPGAASATAAAAASSRSAPRSAMQTRSPIAAKRVAAASPMPEAPPVTTATASLVSAGCGMIFSPSFIRTGIHPSRHSSGQALTRAGPNPSRP